MLLMLLAGCIQPTPRFPADTNPVDTTVTVESTHPTGRLLSAFFGLDNGLPLGATVRLCRGAGREDGMPVIFAQEVDVSTVQAGDFQVITQSGQVGAIRCVTMAPAIDPGELRTALLVGEFGSAAGDPPVTVTIIGNVLSQDHTVNFQGATIAVTPLPPGPTLVWAESVPEAQWQVGKPGGPWGSGSGCPLGTTQAVRAVWAGGVTKANGDEADDVARQLYAVTLVASDGSTQRVPPFALADLGDGDNNHLLCLNEPGTPQTVTFPAGHLADPNGDLNPATAIPVVTDMSSH